MSEKGLEKVFNIYAEALKRETGGLSLSERIVKNQYYKNIINLGPRILPFIFKDMQKEPYYWFEALEQLIKPKIDPIAAQHYGNMEKMTNDWLNWAKENNYIT